MPLARYAKSLAATGALVGGLYVLALVAVSLASDERVLGPGTPKHFCGWYLDCHRMVTLVGVERAPAIGEVRADGVFHIVTLRLASDARRAALRLGPLAAAARDDAGRRFARALPAERALAARGSVGLPDTVLAAGGQVTTRLVFDLPRDAVNPRLHVRDGHPVSVVTELLLLGDEDSFLHARTTFALADGREAAERPRPVCGVGAGCDTVVQVLDVRRVPAAGVPPDRVPADGLFYILTLEIRAMDGGPRDADALVAHMRDGAGRTYHRAWDVERRLPALPGRVRWVFDVPDGAPAPRLVLRRPGALNRLLDAVVIPLPSPPPGA